MLVVLVRYTAASPQPAPAAADLISHDAVRALEAQLDNGASIEALRRFDRNLRALTLDNWGAQHSLATPCHRGAFFLANLGRCR